MPYHSVGDSVQFSALQISTAYLSLILLSYIGTAILSTVFCGYFWTHVVHRQGAVLALLAAGTVWGKAVDYLTSFTMARNSKFVRRPGWWLFLYTSQSAVAMVTGLMFALFRIVLLLLVSLVDVARVDRSLLPHFRWLDAGYKGFYGMVLLPEGLGRYFTFTQEQLDGLLEMDAEEKRQQRAALCCGRCFGGGNRAKGKAERHGAGDQGEGNMPPTVLRARAEHRNDFKVDGFTSRSY